MCALAGCDLFYKKTPQLKPNVSHRQH